MKKIALLLLLVSGSSQVALAKTGADNKLVFKKGQSAQLNCEGFGKAFVTEYKYANEFSFLRLIDSKNNTYYLPLTGGNTAVFYEDQISNLGLSTNHGDLSKEMILEKNEWSDSGGDGKWIKHEYKCLSMKK